MTPVVRSRGDGFDAGEVGDRVDCVDHEVVTSACSKSRRSGTVVVPFRSERSTPRCSVSQRAAVGAGALLRVGDAVAGGHQVELSVPDDLLGVERVAVKGLALQEPGQGLQADVRVRRDAHPRWPAHLRGAHVIDEAPRTDRAPTSPGECPAHLDGTHLALPAVVDLEISHCAGTRSCGLSSSLAGSLRSVAITARTFSAAEVMASSSAGVSGSTNRRRTIAT